VYTVALVELTADYKANITRPSKSDLEIGRKALGECSRRKNLAGKRRRIQELTTLSRVLESLD
jgi:hypothetical protein